MKVPLIIEIDKWEVAGQRQSCRTATGLAGSLLYMVPTLRPELQQPYKAVVDELAARIKSAERFLLDLELDLVLAKEVDEDED